MTPSLLVASVLASSTVSSTVEPGVEDEANAPIADTTAQPEYGPFFEEEAPSDTRFGTRPRKRRKTPVLSVGNGAFCFVDDTNCRTSLILSASVGAGMRIPASDVGPDIPYAQFMFRGGLVARPLMWSRRSWHAWGVGVVGSWSRGTGSVTIEGSSADEDQDVESTQRTDAWRAGLHNQIWLSRKPHGLHLDLTLGTVRSEVLTSGTELYGTHAEVAFGWGGWGAVFASGDFLDRDNRIVFGFRGHGIAAGPVIALALAGLALGGAM